jgi:hypothetical protein
MNRKRIFESPDESLERCFAASDSVRNCYALDIHRIAVDPRIGNLILESNLPDSIRSLVTRLMLPKWRCVCDRDEWNAALHPDDSFSERQVPLFGLMLYGASL